MLFFHLQHGLEMFQNKKLLKSLWNFKASIWFFIPYFPQKQTSAAINSWLLPWWSPRPCRRRCLTILWLCGYFVMASKAKKGWLGWHFWLLLHLIFGETQVWTQRLIFFPNCHTIKLPHILLNISPTKKPRKWHLNHAPSYRALIQGMSTGSLPRTVSKEGSLVMPGFRVLDISDGFLQIQMRFYWHFLAFGV